MKWVIRIAVGGVVVLAVALVVLYFSLGALVKKGVEAAGPKVAKVDIKLGGVSLSPFSGSGSLKDLVIGNPEGFKSPTAVKVGKVEMAVKLGSVMSDKIVVDRIHVIAPEITYEGGLSFPGSNLGKIQANIDQFVAANLGGSAATNVAGKKAEKKLQVNELVIKDVKLSVNLAGLGSQMLPIPDITLKDLGAGPEGITPSELAKRIFSEITGKVTAVLAHGLNNVGNAVQGAGKTATDAAGKTVEGLKGLFKK